MFGLALPLIPAMAQLHHQVFVCLCQTHQFHEKAPSSALLFWFMTWMIVVFEAIVEKMEEQTIGVAKVDTLKQKMELLGILCNDSCVPGRYTNLLCPKVLFAILGCDNSWVLLCFVKFQ